LTVVINICDSNTTVWKKQKKKSPIKDNSKLKIYGVRTN